MPICKKTPFFAPTANGKRAIVRVPPCILVLLVMSIGTGSLITCEYGKNGLTTAADTSAAPHAPVIEKTKRVPGSLDKRLFGSWAGVDSSAAIAVAETISLGDDSSVLFELFDSNPKNNGQSSVSRTGYWAISVDTLWLSYIECKLTGFGYLPVDTVRDYAFNFRITDDFRLGLKPAASRSYDWNDWHYYKAVGKHPYYGMVRDSSRLNVTARADTLLFPDNTARFEAFVFGPDTTKVRYIWSSPGDGVVGDTTATGSYQRYFPLQPYRRHEWSVRAINGRGALSEPDFFSFVLPQFPPYVVMHDTTFMCGDSISIPVEAGDTNGTVGMYYWQFSRDTYSAALRDSSPEPVVTLTDTCFFSETVTVTVRDNHGLLSTPAKFRLSVFPARAIGTSRNESPVALCEIGSGELVVVGTSAGEGTLTSATYAAKINNEGRVVKSDTVRVGTYKGTYGYNIPKSVIGWKNGEIVVVGDLDNSYGHNDSGFVFALDAELRVIWGISIRDAGTKGGGVSRVAAANDGTLHVVGYSADDSCTSILGSSGTQTSCRSIWNPYVAAVGGRGEILWQKTYRSYMLNAQPDMVQSGIYTIIASDTLVLLMDQSGTIMGTYPLGLRLQSMAGLNDGKVALVNSMDPKSTLEIREGDGRFAASYAIDMSRPTYMCTLIDGNLLFIGGTRICCVSPDGVSLWNREFKWGIFTTAVGTRDGGVVIAGWSKEFGHGGEDIVLLKFSTDGTRIW